MTEDELFRGYVLHPHVEDVPMPHEWQCHECGRRYQRSDPNVTVLLGGYARVLCCNTYRVVSPGRKER